MKSAIVFLACLLVLCAQGQPANRSNTCKCLNSYVGRISRQLVKGEPVIHQPSIFCPRTEIIITITGNKEKCVNPQSPLGKLILKNSNKHEKKGAASMTTTSSQTNTWSSPRLHSTAKL
ncbi:C-X-C motif chemokine 9 [Lates calcarifer]|uniref:C-X-C motif chemokine 9 n=1 Tax=Lates calcarifer TaxID=8187 RepID=A0A4W6FMM2_LATCA|nr:C-X-C motif chemokine 9 [Lates calcarifer]XP_018524781.1 C-X-C motif chemokine 9 [Lates calcarifer]